MAAAPGRGRAGLHDGVDRMGRDPHRPVLRRPDRRPHAPDGGQLPDRSRGARVGAGARSCARRHSPRPAAPRAGHVARGAAGRGRYPGDLGHRHAGSDAAAAERRGPAARRHARRGRRGDAVERARVSPTWDAVDHVSTVATRQPFPIAPERERRARAVLVDYGVKLSLLPRSQRAASRSSGCRPTPRPRMSRPRSRPRRALAWAR